MKISKALFTRSPAFRWGWAGAFRCLPAVLLLACLAVPARAADPTKVTELLTKELKGIPGKEMLAITVEYPPGGEDPVHRHNASAFIYVLEGTIVMQMRGGASKTLHPGDTFYEDPEGIHQVGRNASKTKPAKFLVVMVKDAGTPVLIPVTN